MPKFVLGLVAVLCLVSGILSREPLEGDLDAKTLEQVKAAVEKHRAAGDSRDLLYRRIEHHLRYDINFPTKDAGGLIELRKELVKESKEAGAASATILQGMLKQFALPIEHWCIKGMEKDWEFEPSYLVRLKKLQKGLEGKNESEARAVLTKYEDGWGLSGIWSVLNDIGKELDHRALLNKQRPEWERLGREVAESKPDFVLPHDGRLKGLAFSPDGKTIVTIDGYGPYLWRFNGKDQPSKVHVLPRDDFSRNAIFSADGKTVSLEHGLGVPQARHVYDTASGTLIKKESLKVSAADYAWLGWDKGYIEAFHQPTKIVVWKGWHSDELKVRRYPEGTVISQFTHARLSTGEAALSLDGKMVVTGGYDGTVQVHDAATGAKLFQKRYGRGFDAEYDKRRGHWVVGVAFSHDNQWVAAGGTDDVKIWSLPLKK